MSRKTFAFAGGSIGLCIFLVAALLPSIVYGGFAGVTVSSILLGEPLDGQLLSKVLIGIGSIAGILCTAGLFVIGGAALGSGIYRLARMSPIKVTKKKR